MDIQEIVTKIKETEAPFLIDIPLFLWYKYVL